MNPASVSYDLHRQGITSADGDAAPIDTLDHTLCLETQVLVKVSGANVSATLVMEIEREPTRTDITGHRVIRYPAARHC